MEVSDYVLQDFSSREAEVLEIILVQAVEAVLTFIDEGIERAMTAYNQTTDPQNTP
jgi:PTH1 family peptidyl-tRNA hydrolase